MASSPPSQTPGAKHNPCETCASIIVGVLGVACLLFVAFLVVHEIVVEERKDKPKNDDGKPGRRSTRQNADAESSFAVSSTHFQDAHQKLGEAGPADWWTGGSATGYGMQNVFFRNQLSRITEANTQVDGVVQAQGEQVQNTRATLHNLISGLQAAIPVAQALYFSGPAGPAVSYSFQISVGTPALNTATNSVNTMQQNATGHGQRLTALSVEYDDALQAIATPTSAGSLTSQSTAPTGIDSDFIKNLAPIHQQAAGTFAAAGTTVRGSAAAISTAHGRVCDASKDALQHIEDIHNVLAAAMQQYSTDLAAAMPAVANAYDSTDERATRDLDRQRA